MRLIVEFFLFCYRKLIPIKIRIWVKKKWIIKYFEKHEEFAGGGAISSLKNGNFYPYDFIKKYNQKDIIVYTDADCNMKYVLQNNKKLYFKKGWNEKDVIHYYHGLILEQDVDSPHRYEFSDFCVQEGDIVADIGAAEGNFALSIIEKVKKIYLFECDKGWNDALQKTFAPWKEKVIVINKYVSSINSDTHIRFDDFINKNEVNFIKIDIEGDELQFLHGASEILTANGALKLAICTYHKQNDAVEFERLLVNNGFDVKLSDGYMLIGDKPPCYLRKGLIRATRLGVL